MAEKSIENESNDPELLIDAKQPFLPEIGRELCRVRDSDVIGPRHYSDIGRAEAKFRTQPSNHNRIVHLSKQGSGEGHVIRTDSLNMGGSLESRYKSDRGEIRGYRQDILKENLSERESTFLLCNRCKGIMREACISSNGEQFCECCRKLRAHDLYEYTSPNTHVRNTVLSLKCTCPLHKRGCEWLGTLGECENHLDVCSHVHEKCKLGCHRVLQRHELSIHVSEKCNFREKPCEYCQRDFKVCDIPNHIEECPKMLLKCELGCGTVVYREEMATHLKKVCGRVLEHCKLGCGIELPRDKLDVHVNTKCVQRMIPCEYCHIDFKAYDMRNHLEKCPAMPLKCELGCGTVVNREEMAQHLKKDCRRVIEHCKLGCGIELPRDELDMHVNDECVQRMIPCKYCKRDFKVCDMRNHMEECPRMPLTCELGCGTVACRDDMTRHLDEECVEKMIECPFGKYKCEVGLIKRKELNQHLEEKRTEHTELKLSALEEIVMQQSEKINKQNEMNDKQKELISKQGKEIEEQKDLNSKHRERFTTLRAVTKTTIEAWRIENLRGILFLNSPPSYKPFEVAGFKFDLVFSDTVSISMHFPPQVVSQANKIEWPFRAKFVIRLLCHVKPCDPWEFTSKLIEVKQKDCTKKQYSCKIVEIPANNGIFLRDGGIDLQIFVILQ